VYILMRRKKERSLNTTRRNFLQRAGAGAVVYKLAGARPQLKAASKNDQIGLGFIGVGIRGTFLLQGSRRSLECVR